MFVTLANVQRGQAFGLQQYIDNRANSLRVGLRSINFTVGWYNVELGESFSWQSGEGSINTLNIPPGLYGFTQLKDLIESSDINVGLEVNKANGLMTLTVPDGSKVQLTDGLLTLLGLEDGLGGQWLDGGTYLARSPVDFMGTKTLHIHLEQINSFQNILNGGPSTLLTTVGLGCHAFGEINTLRVEHPELKRLQSGTISEFKVVVLDDRGRRINNHQLPISLVLEVVSS